MARSIPLISIVLICVLSFSMFGCNYLVEDNLIPDVELRSEIEWELNIPNDTPITAEDMLKLTELDAEYSYGALDSLFGDDDTPISNLTGLEYAENLVVLNLNNNNIVDVSSLTD